MQIFYTQKMLYVYRNCILNGLYTLDWTLCAQTQRRLVETSTGSLLATDSLDFALIYVHPNCICVAPRWASPLSLSAQGLS
jgi:hypothetical protein